MDSDALPSMLGELLVSGDYSDFTITCKGRTFNVHRAVVCPQSSFFAAALNGRFLVSLRAAMAVVLQRGST